MHGSPSVVVLDTGPGCLIDYYAWFRAAAHGDVLVYWTGDLRYDRDPDNCPAEALTERRPLILALDNLARRLLTDAADGALVLLQKRLGENLYEYRAVRRRRELEEPARRRHDLPLAAE